MSLNKVFSNDSLRLNNVLVKLWVGGLPYTSTPVELIVIPESVRDFM